MKAKTIDEAKKLAKAYSYEKENEDVDVEVYIIYCNRSELYYVDTDGFIRLWEQIAGYYVNGLYTEY